MNFPISTRSFSFLLIVLVSAILFSTYSPGIYAEEAPIGQVIWVTGNVTAAQPTQAPRVLQRRSPLYEHDVISTGTSAQGQIAFTDSSTVALNGDSQFKIDQYVYKKDSPSADKSVMSVVKGGFRTITGAIPKANPDGYAINSPVATIGVRGTQYAVFFSSKKGLLLHIEKGEIVISNSAGKISMHVCEKTSEHTCIEYAKVGSFNSAPEALTSLPPELKDLVTLQPISEKTINSITATLQGGSGGSGTNNGPPKTVSNFCVSMLKDTFVGKHFC